MQRNPENELPEYARYVPCRGPGAMISLQSNLVRVQTHDRPCTYIRCRHVVEASRRVARRSGRRHTGAPMRFRRMLASP